ncbi:MAG: PIN domain-containing protein [Deltaproteobacteria bacterium]|nr:PIN domain-containing protein [Deltaproteobacteria bacterium]
MIAAATPVFVDTGAWIALAEQRDPLHPRARAQWEALARGGARLRTSVPVVIETFTFLERKGSPALARRWQQSLAAIRWFEILDCQASDLSAAFRLLDGSSLHGLSLVDATSFVLMRKHRIRVGFAFDTHFTAAGFRVVG